MRRHEGPGSWALDQPTEPVCPWTRLCTVRGVQRKDPEPGLWILVSGVDGDDDHRYDCRHHGESQDLKAKINHARSERPDQNRSVLDHLVLDLVSALSADLVGTGATVTGTVSMYTPTVSFDRAYHA